MLLLLLLLLLLSAVGGQHFVNRHFSFCRQSFAFAFAFERTLLLLLLLLSAVGGQHFVNRHYRFVAIFSFCRPSIAPALAFAFERTFLLLLLLLLLLSGVGGQLLLSGVRGQHFVKSHYRFVAIALKLCLESAPYPQCF